MTGKTHVLDIPWQETRILNCSFCGIMIARSYWEDDEFRPASSVHLAIAVSLRQGGLVSPALRDADDLSSHRPFDIDGSTPPDVVVHERGGEGRMGPPRVIADIDVVEVRVEHDRRCRAAAGHRAAHVGRGAPARAGVRTGRDRSSAGGASGPRTRSD